MRSLFFYFLCCLSIGYSQFSLRTEHSGGAKNSADKNIFRATLMKDGAPVTTIERTIPFDVPFPSVSVNETTGMFILNYTFDGFVEVYTASGKKLWEQNFFKEKKPNYERTITIALGAASIAFLTSDVTLPNAIVHRFTTTGTQEWETALPYSMGFEVALSPDEKTVVAGAYEVNKGEVKQQAAFVDAKGNITGAADILFRSAAFTTDGSMLALASEREVLLYSLPEMKVSFRGAAVNAGSVINTILWQGDELMVQQSAVKFTPENQFYFAEPVFVRYDRTLTERSRKSMPGISFKRSSIERDPTGLIFRYDSNSAPILR
ncbi:MAG: hypothetical protein ACOYNS_04565 [Bacteroidota bacterium]